MIKINKETIICAFNVIPAKNLFEHTGSRYNISTVYLSETEGHYQESFPNSESLDWLKMHFSA